MKDKGLLDNPLLDDGVRLGKKAMSGYEKAQKWIWYLTMAKYGAIGILVVGLLWGGYAFISNVGDMVSDAVVEETKAVATEKYTEAKTKAAEKVAEIKEKTEGKSLTGALIGFAKQAEAKMNKAVDEVLVETGFSPDAPNECALQDPAHASADCLPYTNNEIPGEGYLAINLWDSACPIQHAKAAELIKYNGKVTQNDYRIMREACDIELTKKTEEYVEQYKRQIIDGAQ